MIYDFKGKKLCCKISCSFFYEENTKGTCLSAIFSYELRISSLESHLASVEYVVQYTYSRLQLYTGTGSARSWFRYTNQYVTPTLKARRSFNLKALSQKLIFAVSDESPQKNNLVRSLIVREVAFYIKRKHFPTIASLSTSGRPNNCLQVLRIG